MHRGIPEVVTFSVCRVYLAGTHGPVIFCLHGGGYSGLTWALLAKQLKGRYHHKDACTDVPRSALDFLFFTHNLHHAPVKQPSTTHEYQQYHCVHAVINLCMALCYCATFSTSCAATAGSDWQLLIKGAMGARTQARMRTCPQTCWSRYTAAWLPP